MMPLITNMKEDRLPHAERRLLYSNPIVLHFESEFILAYNMIESFYERTENCTGLGGHH